MVEQNEILFSKEELKMIEYYACQNPQLQNPSIINIGIYSK